MRDRIVVLTGGVGGAKLARGLAGLMPPQKITAIVNTADDFTHLGLYVSPDIDSVLYALADESNHALGWGREGETWAFMAALRQLGGEDWFMLGDKDLAMHVLRSHALSAGATLSAITMQLARSMGVNVNLVPMSDDPVATYLQTDEGELSFQHYFVERRCAPIVRKIEFRNADRARPAPAVLAAISDPATAAIVIAPSNPWLSVDPILAVPGIADALRTASAPVVAVSPIIGGKAVKGPTAKLMEELGLTVSNASIEGHYGDLLNGMLVDWRDGKPEGALAYAQADTLMTTLDDRLRVAAAVLDLARSIS